MLVSQVKLYTSPTPNPKLSAKPDNNYRWFRGWITR